MCVTGGSKSIPCRLPLQGGKWCSLKGLLLRGRECVEVCAPAVRRIGDVIRNALFPPEWMGDTLKGCAPYSTSG